MSVAVIKKSLKIFYQMASHTRRE